MVIMSNQIQIDEDISKIWGATIEQQFLSQKSVGDQSNTNQVGESQHVNSQKLWQDMIQMASSYASQNDSSYSMPTGNLSDWDGDIESRSIATAIGSLEERDHQDVNNPSNDFGVIVPDVIHLDDTILEKINLECERAAVGGSLSDKLTGDDTDSDPEPYTPHIPPRPVAITSSDRCTTPQFSNVHRSLRFPNSPGANTRASEIFHYTYETDLVAPSSPVPHFVVVPDSGVASRVTVTPTGRVTQSPRVQENSNRSFYKHVCVFLLTSVLILSLVTLAAGIVKAKEMSDSTLPSTNETSLPKTGEPSPVPFVVTPAPSTSGSLFPTLRPILSIPNEDANIIFPDLDGGIIAREETDSPTSSDYLPPTGPPRTRRPTTEPTVIASSDGFNFTSVSPSFVGEEIDDLSSNSTTSDPDEVSVRSYIRNLTTSASPLLSSMLENPSSYQYSAFEWIVLDQLSTDPALPDARILQRFALATLFHSTHGTNWTTSTLWLTSSHECDWYHTGTTYVCDEEGFMHTLEIEGNGLTGSLPQELALLSLSTYICGPFLVKVFYS